ncbi:MAG: nitrate reductase [Rhodospirillales bacterium]|nr:nitrate reductase [Rhodospirillales bacterium]
MPSKVYGDKDDPLYFGYTCIKGREFPAMHLAPERLLASQKRRPDGAHDAIASDLAISEIADRVSHIVAQHGPRSVAMYIGTNGACDVRTAQVGMAWMAALGSRMIFTSITIDQPGKMTAPALHGTWLAGAPTLAHADVWMLIGTNPIISMNGGLQVNPARALKKAKERGFKLIVADPRRTECAREADVYLQCKPGQDVPLLAGLIRVIIEEELYDKAFVARETANFQRLIEAVAPYTAEFVAAHTGISSADLESAARLYASGRRGGVNLGTGPNMAGRANLVEYLGKSLMTICGHWLQEGDEIGNPGVLINRGPAIAGTPGPVPAWGFGMPLRVKDLGETAAGLPTAALPDEILTEGEGKIRALFVLGGNPMLAWPDQIKTHAAMKALDLLVCIDPVMTATGELSHYVIAPTLPLETGQPTIVQEMVQGAGSGWGYPVPYGRWADPIMPVPAGADLIDDWHLFYRIAQAQKLQLNILPASYLNPMLGRDYAVSPDMSRVPSDDEIWRIMLNGSPVSLSELRAKASDRGVIFDRPIMRVEARPEDWTGRLELGDLTMMAELALVAAEPAEPSPGDFAFRLVSRRLNDMHNSSWHFSPKQRRRWGYNPAFIHPDDAMRLSVKTGDLVEIRSRRAAITGVIEVTNDLRPGVVSMAHGFGKNPGEHEDPRSNGASTGRLISADVDYDPYTGIPRMSAIPVNIRRIEGDGAGKG